jgi:uncharacterized membrane protein (GlpM family)
MFALKLLLSPALIGLVSLAGRRWGPSVSGWLVGLPLTSGPVVFLLALAQGTAFAARASQGTLLGLISVVSFCLAYGWCSFRLNWLGCLLIGWCAFFLSTALLLHVSAPLLLTFGCVIAATILALVLFPRRRKQAPVPLTPPWETPLRMVMAATFVLLITGISGVIGPQLSGLLTPFPMFASILGAFTHRFQGAEAARQSLSSVIVGSFASSVYLVVVAGLLERLGIPLAFSLAALAMILTHGCSFWFMQKRGW